MREVIATGKTVEEATENGCKELGLNRDEVSVEILEMPVRKMFKSTPAKVKVTAEGEMDAPQVQAKPEIAPAQPKAAEAPAQKAPQPQQAPRQPQEMPDHVLVTEPEEPIDLATDEAARMAVEYLSGIFRAMGAADVKMSAVRQGDATLLRVEDEDLVALMDIKGETIQALSYLADRAVNKGVDKRDDNYLRIRLDIAGYRNRRETELIALAHKTGAEVARTKRSRTLAPMNSYERLIVHTAISKMEGLMSESIGADAERRVVVKSTAPDATDGEDWRPPRKGGGGSRGGDRNRRGGGGRSGGGGRGSYDGGNRQGGNRGGGDRGRPGGGRGSSGGAPRSNTPEREYADRPRNDGAAPKVPERREAIKDGEDLPLYGKIEI